MKVDPKTGQMLDDSPENPDPDEAGGKRAGDAGMQGATANGSDANIMHKGRAADGDGGASDTDDASGKLPGEKSSPQ